jgi:thymidylate synthase
MSIIYCPVEQRDPDPQYQQALRHIVEHGERISDTPQGVAALTAFGTVPPLVYDLKKGIPWITERDIRGYGLKAINEFCAFINGVEDNERLKNEFGVPWWSTWATDEKCDKLGIARNTLGPASYGPAMAAFPTPHGGHFDQFAHVVHMLKDPKLRTRRTIMITPWIPFWNAWGGAQKAVVSPCHGWCHIRSVLPGTFDLIMWQRSGDFPIGVPGDMIMYTAFMLSLGHVTGLTPRRIVFQYGDAHIYENQLDAVHALLQREYRTCPTLTLKDPPATLREFRSVHFVLSDYNPHPAMKDIPVAR